MIWIGGWFVCVIAGAIVGNSRGRLLGGLLLGLIFGPVGVFAAAFLAHAGPQCPECKTSIRVGASRCPSCRSAVLWDGKQPMALPKGYESRTE